MKKGFTLVELLAVIVILAIISLIAVPIVISVINDSRDKALERSIDNYIHAVNLAISDYNISHHLSDATCNIQSDGNLNCGGTVINVTVEKRKPTSGYIVIKDYKVLEYYGVTMGNDTVGGEFNGTLVEAAVNETHKGIVYLDPTNLSRTCNAQLAAANLNEFNTPTGIKSGCMKFYIYDDSGDTYKMILDHNTTRTVAWISENDFLAAGGSSTDWNNYYDINKKGPITINAQLATDTAGWVGNPRLITADEVAHIAGVDTMFGFNSTTNSTNDWFHFGASGSAYEDLQQAPPADSRYAWLYDYTYHCEENNCNAQDNFNESTNWITIQGYWTSSPGYSDWNDSAWMVSCYGNLGSYYAENNNSFGIRPVITLPKTLFED